MSMLTQEEEEWLYQADDENANLNLRPGDYVRKIGDLFSDVPKEKTRVGLVVALWPAEGAPRSRFGAVDVLVLWGEH